MGNEPAARTRGGALDGPGPIRVFDGTLIGFSNASGGEETDAIMRKMFLRTAIDATGFLALPTASTYGRESRERQAMGG